MEPNQVYFHFVESQSSLSDEMKRNSIQLKERQLINDDGKNCVQWMIAGRGKGERWKAKDTEIEGQANEGEKWK